MGLLAHKGTNIVDEETVLAIPEPPYTETWHPVGHAKAIDAFGHAVKNVGLEVSDRRYSVSASGGNMFGAWTLSEGDGKSNWALGIRNSIQKKFAVGVCSGQNVLVCDNMAFSGEFVEFRKHTRGLDYYELKAMAARAVITVVGLLKKFDNWVSGLREIALPGGHFKVLTFNAMERGVVSPKQFERFLECHKEEKKLNGETLYSFHGAATRLMRDNTLFSVAEKNRALVGVVNEYQQLMAGM